MMCLYQKTGTRKDLTVFQHPCGRCVPCRIQKRQQWTLRNYLELEDHKHACFVTLTYAPEHLPKHLVKDHFQKFIHSLRKRARKDLSLDKIRYFGCGEYGDKFHRPHYHIIIYGLSEADSCHRKLIEKSWPYGFVHMGSVTLQSVQYVAGYTLKKSAITPNTTDNLVPEFSLMSKRPGIGSQRLKLLAKKLKDKGLVDRYSDTVLLQESHLMNSSIEHLRVSGRLLPLDRYAKNLLQNRSSVLETTRHNLQSQDMIETVISNPVEFFLQQADQVVKSNEKANTIRLKKNRL